MCKDEYEDEDEDKDEDENDEGTCEDENENKDEYESMRMRMSMRKKKMIELRMVEESLSVSLLSRHFLPTRSDSRWVFSHFRLTLNLRHRIAVRNSLTSKLNCRRASARIEGRSSSKST